MLEKVTQVWDRLRAWNAERARLSPWMCLIVIVVVALAVEVLGFNFRHWQSLGYEEVSLRDTPMRVTSEGYSLGFSSLDMDVKNVKIDIADTDTDSSVWIQIAVTDEGNSTSYYLPVVQEHSRNERSKIHTIFTYGNIKSLRVTFPGDVYGGVDGSILVANNEFPLTVTGISVNAQVPFSFSWLRFSLLAGGLLILWGLRPGGVCGRIRALDRGWPARLVRGGVLAVLLVGCVVFTLSFPRWFNVATPSYNSSDYNASGKLPWTTLDQPDTATNEYAKLAQAFAEGQLDLLQTPPDWLKEMDDPYDYGARSEESSHHLRGYLWDTAYYDGHYYVYFGVLPALVFYLPYYLITGSTFPNAVGVLICSLLFVVGAYSLLRALIRWRFTKASLSTFVLVLLGVVFASGLLFGLARPGMYNVPVTMARCLAVWGLCLWYRGWNLRSPVRLAAGSLLVALIAATRPQLLILAPLVFVLLLLVLRARREDAVARGAAGGSAVAAGLPGAAEGLQGAVAASALPGADAFAAVRSDAFVAAGGHAPAVADGPLALTQAQKAGWSACLLVPFVLVAAGVMWYNWARFDSPFDFGAAYNLTFNNMTMRGHSKLRALEGLYYYLFNPPSVVTNFPFLKLGAIYPTFPGTTIYEPLFGGLLLLEPMLLASAFVFGLRRDRGVARADKPLFWMAGYFLAAGVVLVLFDTEGAGILLRYMQDFGLLFALSAALVFLHHLGGAGGAEALSHAALSAAHASEPVGWREVLSTDEGPVGAHAEGRDAEATSVEVAAAAVKTAAAGDAAAAVTGKAPAAGDAAAIAAGDATAGQAPSADMPVAAVDADVQGTSPAPTSPARPRHRSPWAVALFVCVFVGYVTAVLMGLLEHDPTGDLSTGGAYPLDWENLRQTFMWWL